MSQCVLWRWIVSQWIVGELAFDAFPLGREGLWNMYSRDRIFNKFRVSCISLFNNFISCMYFCVLIFFVYVSCINKVSCFRVSG